MSPEKLTTVLHALFAAAFISIAAVFVFPIPLIGYVAVGVFMLSILVSCALPYFTTVRCPTPGCNGTMQRVWGQGPNCSQSLSYRCRICGETFDTHVSFGGGSDF